MPVGEDPELAGPIECQTAIVLYLLPNGLWQVSDDIDLPLMPERKMHADDVTAACAVALRDAQTRELVQLAIHQLAPQIVQGVIQGQLQVGAAIREQQAQAALTAKLEEDKQRRGGR
jgi:hypothetical protein